MTTYNMVMIGGKARMSRPSNVLYPLPSTRCDRKVNAGHVHVAGIERTVYARPASMEWKPGTMLARTIPTLVRG
jgi:hypothetical protein